jgi:DUF1365 family protein
MADPVTLYNGKVMHARMKPVLHRFNYKMSSILVDLDRLDEADRQCAVFSVNKFNLVSFQSRDFGPKDGSDLRSYVDSLTDKAGLIRADSVKLLCYPRVFGYGFNPISVYFCRDETSRMTCVIYEVRNTFGEMHTYVQPVQAKQQSVAGIRQEANKEFYVSPFMDMQMRYFFRVSGPDDKIALRILEKDNEGPILAATFFGEKSNANSMSFAKAIMQTLGLTWKVTAGIHYEALKLWIKGLKIRPRIAHNLSHSFPDRLKMADQRTKSAGIQGGKFNEQ